VASKTARASISQTNTSPQKQTPPTANAQHEGRSTTLMYSPAPARARTIILLALFASLSLSAGAQTNAPPPSPCKSKPEYRQFDFWIGEWDVLNPQGQPAGTNSVQLILNDCVIFENWTGRGGGQGKSVNVYNSVKGKWQQTWVDGFGSVLELYGELVDGEMRFTGESLRRDGKKLLNRLTFSKLSPDKVRQFWQQSDDDGKTWTVAFDGTYVRRKTGGR
jgi:hypothetical protein